MKKLFIIAALFILQSQLIAQTSKTDPKDWQGWMGGTLKFDLPKKWTPYIEYQARTYNNLKTYNGSYISIGVQKKVSKFVHLVGEYRLALVQKGTYHRYTFGAEYEKEKKKWDWGVRLLLQNQLQDFDEANKATQDEFYWRVRLGAKYELSKKVAAFASIEPIMKSGGRHFVDNLRNQLGLRFKIAPKTKLDVFYIYRPDYAKSYNRTFNIVGFDLIHTIKPKKKKK